MADFCQQCSIEHLGADYKDFVGLVTEEEGLAGVVALVLCEGCGNAEVDHNGRCHSPNCFDKHGAK